MTIQEFDKQKWGVGMKAIYANELAGDEKEYDISTVDFIEKLVGLEDGEEVFNEETGKNYWEHKIMWVRCENVELLKTNSTAQLVENK